MESPNIDVATVVEKGGAVAVPLEAPAAVTLSSAAGVKADEALPVFPDIFVEASAARAVNVAASASSRALLLLVASATSTSCASHDLNNTIAVWDECACAYACCLGAEADNDDDDDDDDEVGVV